MLKTGKKFGPEFVEESEEEQAVKQELEELATQANIKLEEENTKKQVILLLSLQIIILVGVTFGN